MFITHYTYLFMGISNVNKINLLLVLALVITGTTSHGVMNFGDLFFFNFLFLGKKKYHK